MCVPLKFLRCPRAPAGLRSFFVALIVTLGALPILAQDNYEIQVYPYETVAPGSTMVELHSNFTAQGKKTVVDRVAPSNHAVHETLEITQGFTDWFETGFYLFTSIQPKGGWEGGGNHIRPPVRAINFGVGIGMTCPTDHLIIKGILGRRFSWKRGKRSLQ